MSRFSMHLPPKIHQRGAFSILTAFTLLVLLLFLALVVDGGRLYMEQRKLQKIADMAALEAVARLENGNCAAEPVNAAGYADENALRHGFVQNSGQSLLTQCATVKIGRASCREGVQVARA